MAGSCSCWHTYCCKPPFWLRLLRPGKHCGRGERGCQFPKGTPLNGATREETPAPSQSSKPLGPRRRPGPRAGTGSAMGGRERKDVRKKRKKNGN